MKPERWARIEDLYHRALEVEESHRSAFLREVCEGNRGLQEEVERLLASDGRASSFLEEPAFKGAARELALDRPTADLLEDVASTRLGPGAQLGPYRIEGPLGKGGMGEVYRAKDTKLKRDVAIKVLPDLFARYRPTRRFQREAQVLASLNHPNIANIYGLEDSNGIRALVMELVEGPTLADRITKGPIPVEEALLIAKQIAEAFEAAHEVRVVHRDLKPANIKVRLDGVVKVLDFGLAKALAPAPADAPTLTTISTQATRSWGLPLI